MELTKIIVEFGESDGVNEKTETLARVQKEGGILISDIYFICKTVGGNMIIEIFDRLYLNNVIVQKK
ncbi:hypothetical protein [Methanosarcina sp.]|jgi:hypothetical protein|uniref:hypothetical protein n=1 Tax=Methanosarcina sp. TaxID=2213 RepID=UPI002B80D7E6|nr:hypothetical protein [Methanosarcina sp.]HOW14404.1 hypothetical protein [Methanosarcina sp.]